MGGLAPFEEEQDRCLAKTGVADLLHATRFGRRGLWRVRRALFDPELDEPPFELVEFAVRAARALGVWCGLQPDHPGCAGATPVVWRYVVAADGDLLPGAKSHVPQEHLDRRLGRL